MSDTAPRSDAARIIWLNQNCDNFTLSINKPENIENGYIFAAIGGDFYSTHFLIVDITATLAECMKAMWAVRPPEPEEPEAPPEEEETGDSEE